MLAVARRFLTNEADAADAVQDAFLSAFRALGSFRECSEELDQLRPAQDRALRLERFLAPAQLDPLLYAGRSLYLLPDGPAAAPGYAVLQAALVARQRWALGRMVLGGHRQVVLLQPAETALVVHVLHYPEQVRYCPQAAPPVPSACCIDAAP
jgi:non-homologous end joining protein Ku